MTSYPSGVSLHPQLGVICKLTECAIDPTVHVIHEDIENDLVPLQTPGGLPCSASGGADLPAGSHTRARGLIILIHKYLLGVK